MEMLNRVKTHPLDGTMKPDVFDLKGATADLIKGFSHEKTDKEQRYIKVRLKSHRVSSITRILLGANPERQPIYEVESGGQLPRLHPFRPHISPVRLPDLLHLEAEFSCSLELCVVLLLLER